MHPAQLDQEAALDEHLSLTDQDVDILHQIITRAEEHPDVQRLPFRAIFSAYDEVLHEHGIEAQNDQNCFRFLFQLGSKKFDGHGLYERFVELLARMGIQLVYDEDQNEGNGATREPAQRTPGVVANHSAERAERNAQQARDKKPRGRRRRASFSSMYDATDDVERKGERRMSSRSSVSRLELGTDAPDHWKEAKGSAEGPRRENEAAPNGIIRRAPPDPRHYTLNRTQLPTRANILENISHPEVDAQFERYLTAASKKTGHRPQTGNASDEASDTTSSSDSTGDNDEADPIPRQPPPQEFIYRPSLTDLLRDASTFNMYRERNSTRRLLIRWADQARRHRELFEHFFQTAANRDALTLKRQAFDIWHANLIQKRQEAETDRFFKHLEIRATRARDFYLLTKTLSTWRGRAAEEAKKTREARKHILAVKYFNAWKEITETNETKVHRFTLQGLFKAWRAKLRRLSDYEEQARAADNARLMRSKYWTWFWTFCDQRAPHLRDHRLKQKHLVLWIRALRAKREQQAEAVAQDGYVLLHASFQSWKNRHDDLVVAEHAADERWKRKRLSDCLTEWHVRTRLGHIAVQVSTSVKTRRIRAVFDTWAVRTHLQRQAKEVDRRRMMQSAWTAWNDKLRIQALAQRIDERIMMQTLYNWLLMERQQLMTRIHDQRLMRNAYDKMYVGTKKAFDKLLNREEKFKTRFRRKTLRANLEKWRGKLEMLREKNVVAAGFYAPRLQQDSLTVWKGRMGQIKEYEGWADKARFYFMMKTIIHKWRDVTKEHEKKHRLDAYAAIRRRHKMNIASSALTTWNAKTLHILELENVANGYAHEAAMRKTGVYIRHWYQIAAARAQAVHDADIHYNRNLVHTQLLRMVERQYSHSEMERTAGQLWEGHVSRVAAAQLRKLSLRLFQFRASIETADRQKERSVKKQQFKRLLQTWLEKTRTIKASKTPTPSRTYSATPASGFNASGPRRTVSRDSTRPSSSRENEPLIPTTTPISARPWTRASGLSRSHTPLSAAVPNRPHTSFSRFNTPGAAGAAGAADAAGTPATPAYLSESNRPSTRTKQLSSLADGSTTPATPSITPFAARLMAQLSDDQRPQSTGRRTFHRRGRGNSSLATVRFADDEDDDPEEGSPSKGRSTIRSSISGNGEGNQHSFSARA